jgi:hypothetical protein
MDTFNFREMIPRVAREGGRHQLPAMKAKSRANKNINRRGPERESKKAIEGTANH